MGKGDKKTKRGKIWRGSYGNVRPKKANQAPVATDTKKEVKEEKEEKKEA